MDKDAENQSSIDQDLVGYLAEISPGQRARIDALLGRPPSDDFILTTGLSSRRDHPKPDQPLSTAKNATSGTDDILEIVVAYCNGATPETIAAARHTTEETVRGVLRQAGVILRDHGRTSAEIREQMRTLNDQGLSMRAIARRFDVSHTTVSRILRRRTER